MTKQDAITVLSQLGEQKVSMIINDALFFGNQNANWCIEYLNTHNTPADIVLEGNTFEFFEAWNHMENEKHENNTTPCYSKEQIEELESEHFYAQLCKSSYKLLHHK